MRRDIDMQSGRQSLPYEIFVPTADGEQPLGDYLFVPREFQVQLLKDIERRQGRLAGWLLQSAEYRVALSRSVPPRTVLESLTAEYEIYVPELNPPVHLPLAAAAAGVLEREGRLDGRPVVLQWLAESAALVLPVQQAGLHRLQLTFRPTAQTEDGISVLDLPVPPVPRAVDLKHAGQNGIRADRRGAGHGAAAGIQRATSGGARADRSAGDTLGSSFARPRRRWSNRVGCGCCPSRFDWMYGSSSIPGADLHRAF